MSGFVSCFNPSTGQHEWAVRQGSDSSNDSSSSMSNDLSASHYGDMLNDTERVSGGKVCDRVCVGKGVFMLFVMFVFVATSDC